MIKREREEMKAVRRGGTLERVNGREARSNTLQDIHIQNERREA